jgi:hypothetical protein
MAWKIDKSSSLPDRLAYYSKAAVLVGLACLLAWMALTALTVPGWLRTAMLCLAAAGPVTGVVLAAVAGVIEGLRTPKDQ